MTVKDLLNKTWYIQEILIIEHNKRDVIESADIERFKANALFYGNNNSSSDSYKATLVRYVDSIGTIDNVLIIEVI